MKKLFILFWVVLISGCATGKLDLNEVSGQEGYKDWIGKTIKLKREVLIVLDNRYDTRNLKVPMYQDYPAIEEYRKNGISKKSWWDREEIIGIAEIGNEFEIVSIGFYTFSSMIGKRGLVLVKSKSGNNLYYLHEDNLFSFKNRGISFNDYYIEVQPALNPAPDEKSRE